MRFLYLGSAAQKQNLVVDEYTEISVDTFPLFCIIIKKASSLEQKAHSADQSKNLWQHKHKDRTICKTHSLRSEI